jgi:hypothetical protein
MEIVLPSMLVKDTFGACFLSFKFKNKNVSKAATISGTNIFAGKLNIGFMFKIWALIIVVLLFYISYIVRFFH